MVTYINVACVLIFMLCGMYPTLMYTSDTE